MTADELVDSITHPVLAFMNHQADALARKGADFHRCPGDVYRSACQLLSSTRAVQSSLATVLSARVLAPPRANRVEGWTRSDLIKSNDWLASVARGIHSSVTARNFLFDFLADGQMATPTEYSEAIQTSLELFSVHSQLSEIQRGGTPPLAEG